MSLWYDQNKKEYASDGKNGWLKAYCQKMCSDVKEYAEAMAEELKNLLKAHGKGENNRHSAESIDYSESQTVKNKIDTESLDRKNMDDILRADIGTEITERKSADNTLQTSINKEVSDRKAADSTLQTSVYNESTARQVAVSELWTSLGTIEDLLTDEKSNIVGAVNELFKKHGYIAETVVETDLNYDEYMDDGIYFIDVYTEGYGDYESEYSNTDVLFVRYLSVGYRHFILQMRYTLNNGAEGNSVYVRYGYDDNENIDWNSWSKISMYSDIERLKKDLAPVATSGDYDDLENAPDLAPVATSGSYTDLTNKPKMRTCATVVVGTSARGYTANDVNYLCSTTSAQTQINNAISSLPSTGGKVILLEGTYNCSGQINVNKPNVTIEGMGKANTILNFKSTNYGIKVTNEKCTIKNLGILREGVISGESRGIQGYTGSTNFKVSGVEVSNYLWGIETLAKNIFVEKVYAHDNYIGVHIGSEYGVITNCVCVDNSEAGINIEGKYQNVTDNLVYATSDYTDSQYTLRTRYSAAYNNIADNYLIGKNYTNSAGSTNTFVNNRYE